MQTKDKQFFITNWQGETTASTADSTQIDSPFDEETARRMIDHMNDDHVDAMIDYCRFASFLTATDTDTDTDTNTNTSDSIDKPIMTGVGGDGFILQLGNKCIKFQFEQMCSTPVDVRKALVELAIKARA